MHDPEDALRQWWALARPGGYLVIVVPDEDLYEQGKWPSLFNKDHKATFTLEKDKSWSPVSYNIEDLIRNLPQVEILGVEIQDVGFDHALFRSPRAEGRRAALNGRTLRRFFVKGFGSIAKRIPVVGANLRRRVENLGFHLGVPIDQTARGALAQIQVVARKRVD